MQTKSIFNPDIHITADKWAVSYVMHNHNTFEREHAFLVVQTPTTFFKKEIYYDDNNPGFARIEEDERAIINASKLHPQFNLLLWKSSSTKYTINDISHRTWLLTSDQVHEMFADIEADVANPPRFSLYGVASILKKGEFEERKMHSAFLASGILVTTGISHVLGNDPIPLGIMAFNALALGTSNLFSENGFFQGFDYRERFKAHNCATWCVEKLTNLNIPHINKELGFNFADKFAYVTGLHLGKDDAEKQFAAALLLEGAKGRCEKAKNEAINKAVNACKSPDQGDISR